MDSTRETGPPAARPASPQSPGMGAQVGLAGAKVADAAGDVAQDVQTRVASLAGDVKDRVASAAEDRKDDVAQGLDDVAKALHQSAGQLEGQDWLAKLIERGSNELGVLAATLRTNDLQGLFRKLAELARRHPAVFVGAAMAAGFAASRVGKSAVAGASEADLPKMPAVFHEPN
jgi:hypothetical protein